MIHQLRIYEIFETNRDAFHARFRDHAARLMRQHGFHIADMWESRSPVIGRQRARLTSVER